MPTLSRPGRGGFWLPSDPNFHVKVCSLYRHRSNRVRRFAKEISTHQCKLELELKYNLVISLLGFQSTAHRRIFTVGIKNGNSFVHWSS